MIGELQEGRTEEKKMLKKRENDKSRAEKREARRKRLEELKAKFAAEEVALDGDVIGYNKQEGNVNALVEGSGRLRSDLLEIRKRKVRFRVWHEGLVGKTCRG